MTELIRKEGVIAGGPNRRRGMKPVNFDEYCHILNQAETKGLFDSLNSLYDTILKFASSDTIRRAKRLVVSEQARDPGRRSSDGRPNADPATGSPDRDDESYGSGRAATRESILDSNRSISENTLLSNRFYEEDSADGSQALSLSYTLDEHDASRTDEDREARRRQRKEKKRKERQFSFAKADDRADPTDYGALNRFLLRCHKLLDKLDSGGKSLRHVFEEREAVQFEAFRLFVMNLEVYGSFSPLNDRLFDLQVTRISAYLKISKIRKGLEFLVLEHEQVKGKFP